jgi:hypothetical protein
MLSASFATVTAKRAFADSWTYPKKGGATAAESLIFFSSTENKILATACDVAGRSGFFMTLNVLKDLMVRIMKSAGREGGRRWSAENEQEISHAYMRKWLKKNKIFRYKNSGLDSKRAEKATETLRDAWFDLIVTEIKRLEAEGSLPSGMDAFEKFHKDQCWNVDEDAANAVKSRDPALMSANSFADGMGRCFAISADGERMGSHVTDVMATCRDGSVGAPMVIKTRGGGDKPQEASRKRRLGEHVQVPGVKLTDKEGLVDDDATDGVKLRLTVKTSNSGSMTIELFIDWCDHFIENTLKPRGLGPGARAPSPCSSLLSSRHTRALSLLSSWHTPFHCFPLGPGLRMPPRHNRPRFFPSPPARPSPSPAALAHLVTRSSYYAPRTTPRHTLLVLRSSDAAVTLAPF